MPSRLTSYDCPAPWSRDVVECGLCWWCACCWGVEAAFGCCCWPAAAATAATIAWAGVGPDWDWGAHRGNLTLWSGRAARVEAAEAAPLRAPRAPELRLTVHRATFAGSPGTSACGCRCDPRSACFHARTLSSRLCYRPKAPPTDRVSATANRE